MVGKNNKKIYLLLILILTIIFGINKLYKLRFGYFIEGPKMNNEHINADIVTLNSGNLLILGEHTVDVNKNRMTHRQINKIPFEIYDVENNKFVEYKFINDIAYYPKGILLKNNNLLLTFAYDYTGKNYLKENSKFPYDSMAIIDLKSQNMKLFQKKINKKYKPNLENTEFTLLNNGNVLIIDFYNKIAELYNPIKNTSEILDVKIDKGIGSKVIAYDNNKALIFGRNSNSLERKVDDNKYDTIEEYNDETKSIRIVGKCLSRNNLVLERINSDGILILGGNKYPTTLENEINVNSIEVYDTNNHNSIEISKLKESREYDSVEKKSSFAIAPINKRYYLISGGFSVGGINFRTSKRSTELLDLKHNKIMSGPQMLNRYSHHKMVKLKNGNILVLKNYSQRTEIFKVLKGVKLWIIHNS